MRHFAYIPFTGLGLFNGRRRNPWLKNRIHIFKEFVVPSLTEQTVQNFVIWVSWRGEERGEKQVLELEEYLVSLFGRSRVVFTYHGVCFWDDKYPDAVAHERLVTSLHFSIPSLLGYIGDVSDVVMTIQPSDDCYHVGAFAEIQREIQDCQAVGYTKGYIMSYQTKEVREYNPETNPPFFSIKFPKDVFIDPFRHLKHTGPYKSHEYVPDFLKYKKLDKRGFLVGTHGENISTHFNIPYAGKMTELQGFDWVKLVSPLKIRYNFIKALRKKLPHSWQRKIRYYLEEKLLNKLS